MFNGHSGESLLDIDKLPAFLYNTFVSLNDPLAQLVEHLTFNQGVPRSSRGWITIFLGPLAQLVEHLTLNQGVVGSRPTWVTKKARWSRG